MSKQDRVAPRTATDIERKYNFGKSFAEVMGIAEDARKVAEEAKDSSSNPAEKLTHDEVFNLLTKNGELQGLYRGDDEELYVNAEYIQALEKLFAKDISMTGKFESTVEAYLPPTYDDAVYLLRALFWPDEYPLPEGYDFDLNGDGVFDEDDAISAMKVYTGELPMSSLPGVAKTTATLRIDMSNSEKTIHIFGTNMWGTYVETFIGADVNNCSFASREYLQRMVNQDPDSTTLYRLVSGEKEYFNPPMEVGVEYRTTERYMGNPVYVQLVSFGALPNTNQASKNVYQGGEGGTANVNHSDIIDITGRAYMGYGDATGEWSAFPFVYGGRDFGADVWYDNELGIVVRTQFNLSNQTAWFTVKYTKTKA